MWYKDFPHIKNTDVPLDRYLPKNCDSGAVFTGHRHGQCIYLKCAVTGLRDSESGEYVQGFLTSKNRFVGREEAGKIAYEAGQTDELKTYLYSEDVW